VKLSKDAKIGVWIVAVVLFAGVAYLVRTHGFGGTQLQVAVSAKLCTTASSDCQILRLTNAQVQVEKAGFATMVNTGPDGLAKVQVPGAGTYVLTTLSVITTEKNLTSTVNVAKGRTTRAEIMGTFDTNLD
jgi:hypothetical protein